MLFIDTSGDMDSGTCQNVFVEGRKGKQSWGVAQVAEGLPSVHGNLRSVPSIYFITAGGGTDLIPALGRRRQQKQKFKAIFN